MDFLKTFWSKYQKRYSLYSGITAGVFLLQIIHLYWLTTHVVSYRLAGFSLFNPNDFWQFVIIFVDYLEIPAIISTSILYVYSLRQGFNKKDLFFLLLLNTQWLHIFWISDEFVESIFLGVESATILPAWLAFVAIIIDYLELPVMYDATKKFIASIVKKNGKNIF